MLPVEQPLKLYTGTDGKPLDNGYVYFGQPNQNPITAPVTVYWDSAGTQPAAQPLRTVNGYIVRNGTPANVFFSGSYSELVQDSRQRQVFYAQTSDDFSIGSNIVKQSGSSLIGFIQAGSGTVARTVQDKLRERISIADYATAGAIGVGNATADTTAILAAVAAIPQGFYAKGSAELFFPTPSQPYRLNQTIDLTEVWNVTLTTGNAFNFQRYNGTVDPTTDNALLHWYGSSGGTMMRLHNSFGVDLDKISLNGRSLAKIGIDIAPATSIASVTREVNLRGADVKYCDFGIRVGDLSAQTDNAPVNILQPHISGCTSAAILVNSGNAAVNIVGAFLINNGNAPTTGNSFISDGNNRGAHINVVAGIVGITDLTTDTDATHSLAGASIVQASGSLRINGAWIDDPTKPFYSGFADGPVYFHGVRHYDASMTITSTPNSIEYNGPQPLELSSCYLYGNVQITSGNQASVIDLGTRFIRSGAGFTGNMVTQYGGLVRMARTENNSLALSVGGDFPSITNGFHSVTAWSDHNRPGLIRAVRNGGYMITEHINSTNGQLYVMGNARFDADAGNYKAIAPGACWRHTYGKNNETFDTYQATSVNEVIATWANVHGFLPGVGANAITILSLSGQKITFDSTAPSTGTWSKADICWNLNATVGLPQGWRCTVAGTPGTWVAMANI